MDNQDDRRRSTTRFLIGSFTMLLIVSAAAFLYLGYYTNRMSKETINKVGKMYMISISDQISSHFETLIDLKLEQVETAVEVVPNDKKDIDKINEELIYRVQVRNFDYLALYSQKGELEMLYGEQVMLADPESFYNSLRRNEKKVAVGKDESGNEVVLFGTNAEYVMKNGEVSMAVVAALPIEYISTMLETEKNGALMYSHIIRKDGSFIVSSLSKEYKDYFSSLYDRFKEEDKSKIDEYIKELSDAMNRKEGYSVIVDFGKNMRQIYCISLPNSEWNLLVVLPFGELNETIEELNRGSTVATVLIFMVILVLLLLIFYLYFKITYKQLTDLELARQDAIKANKAKSEFLSNMSHDIRTPMNAIVGMTAIATAHFNDTEQVQNCLKKIALSGKHLLGLINDVLDMSKIESGKMTLTAERVSLQEVFDGLVSIVQTQIKAKGQDFKLHLTNVIAENVYCDSVRLNQILLNLMSNAVKYTQEGGTIQLSLYQEDAVSPKGSEYVRTHVNVKDNGIGMTPEFLEHIFDSYSRADSHRVHKTEGAGLGMAITKYIVDAMGGTLTVESELGKGTEFHLVLDLEKADEQEIDMCLPPWKMLVVDDDEVLCRTAVDTLDTIGITADWAMSGLKAIELVENHHKLHDDYQIVLLDWKLPDIDGILAARQMRKIIGEDATVILISAYDWSEFETEAKEAGISGFIAKPLFKSTLYYGLKNYMGVEESDNNKVSEVDLSGRRVLVAEDNEINWEILNNLLTDIGMETEWAENGKICLDKFQEAQRGYYDVIFMDVRMPVMNGYETTRAIRALDSDYAKEIPIIAMTADAFSEDIQKCLESGMNAHTAKPINFDEVVSLLKKYIVADKG